MKRTQFVLVLAGIAALALGGSAIAAKSHSHATRAAAGAAPLGHRGPGDDLEAAASYLGKSTSDLVTALQSGKTLASIAAATSGKSAAGLVAALVTHEKQELADAVSGGRLTQAQSDQIASTLQQRFEDFVNGTRPPMMPGGRHDHGLDAAATYLGISADSLATQLRSGKTLAQIANATSGKSASGLIDALVADATKRFGTNLPSDLRQHITDLVNGTMPRMHPMWPGMDRGMRGPGGGHDHWGAPPAGGRRY